MEDPDLSMYASKASTEELYELQSKFKGESQSDKVRQIEIELFKRPTHRKRELGFTILLWLAAVGGFVLSAFALIQGEVSLKGANFSIEKDGFYYWLAIIFLLGFSSLGLKYAIESSNRFNKYVGRAKNSA